MKVIDQLMFIAARFCVKQAVIPTYIVYREG